MLNGNEHLFFQSLVVFVVWQDETVEASVARRKKPRVSVFGYDHLNVAKASNGASIASSEELEEVPFVFLCEISQ